MNWLEVTGISVLSALVTSGLIVAVLRKVLFNYLDRGQLWASQDITFRGKKRAAYLNQRLLAYPELLEICYRAKVVAQECIDQGDLPSNKVEDFGALVSHLTEKLFHYRLYVPKNVWDLLHKTKHICQDLLVWLDVLSRVDASENAALVEMAIESAMEASRALAQNTSELEGLLRTSIGELIHEKL